MRHIVIVGATSVIAGECARLWLAQGDVRLTLVGRDAQRTQEVAARLRETAPTATIELRVVAFDDPAAIDALGAALSTPRAPDIVLIAQGTRADQAACEASGAALRDIWSINAVSPGLFAEAFARHLEAARAGALVLIGSVTGDRGRRANYAYGAAKGMLARHAEGLMHRLHRHGVSVLLVKPGPTDTPQTAHLRGTGARLARPEDVARGIVAAAGRRGGVLYLPGRWRWVMLAVRHIPQRLFDRLDI